MNFNTTCPYCESENAFHNGVNYECPDCDTAYDESGRLSSDDEDNDYETNDQFKEVSKLKEPFFKLKHGKLYECEVSYYDENIGELESETIYIIPLAFDANRNRFWVLLDAKNFIEKYPDAVKDFIEMDFNTIWNDGIDGYFDDGMIMPLTSICATTNEETIVDYNTTYYELVEVVNE